MKKTILCGGFLCILATSVFADIASEIANSQPIDLHPQQELAAANQNDTLITTTPSTQTTNTTQPATTTTTVTTKITTKPATTTTPSPTTAQPVITQTATGQLHNLNCNYHIPAETTKIDPNLVVHWAEKALQQSFSFHYSALDQQLAGLKNCFTDQGWQSFSDALAKSGNLDAIRTQKLVVSSIIDGHPQVVELKDNQWKITFPLQVVYQNDKEKLTQPLNVYLVIGRKINGDLGIMQIIASPRQLTPINQTGGTVTTTPTTTTTTITAPK